MKVASPLFSILCIAGLLFGLSGGVIASLEPLSGPDYELVDVVVSMSETTPGPGAVIHPVLTIQNNASNASDNRTINVSAYLRNTTLIPVSAQVPAIQAGDRKVVAVSFLIPDTIEFGGYPLYLELDPDQETGDIKPDNNRRRAGGILTITIPEEEEFFGCEACWEGYR